MDAHGSILIPLDGSERAERIVPLGRALASRLALVLVLVRVVAQDASTNEYDEASEYLRSVATTVLVPVRVRVSVLRGEPAATIVRAVGEHDAELIVMSTHGHTGLTRLLMGSVAESVVHESPVPVILVSDEAAAALPPEGIGDGPIVLPTDGSPMATSVIPLAERFGCSLGRRVHVVDVVTPITTPTLTIGAGYAGSVLVDAYALEAARQEAELVVGDARASLEAAGCSVTTEVRVGLPGDELLEVITRERAALVTMATHGRTGIVRTVLGSVADFLVRRAPCPVLLRGPSVATTP